MNRSLERAYKAAAREERKPRKVSYPPWVVPPPGVSELLTGLLYIGRRPRSYEGYDLIVSCETQRPDPPKGFEGLVLWCPFSDVEGEPPASVSLAAALVVEAMRAGKSVLVHCSLGLNRSALVAALALSRYHGISTKSALGMLVMKHSGAVLSNRSFERWLVGE